MTRNSWSRGAVRGRCERYTITRAHVPFVGCGPHEREIELPLCHQGEGGSRKSCETVAPMAQSPSIKVLLFGSGTEFRGAKRWATTSGRRATDVLFCNNVD